MSTQLSATLLAGIRTTTRKRDSGVAGDWRTSDDEEALESGRRQDDAAGRAVVSHRQRVRYFACVCMGTVVTLSISCTLS